MSGRTTESEPGKYFPKTVTVLCLYVCVCVCVIVSKTSRRVDSCGPDFAPMLDRFFLCVDCFTWCVCVCMCACVRVRVCVMHLWKPSVFLNGKKGEKAKEEGNTSHWRWGKKRSECSDSRCELIPPYEFPFMCRPVSLCEIMCNFFCCKCAQFYEVKKSSRCMITIEIKFEMITLFVIFIWDRILNVYLILMTEKTCFRGLQ